MRKEDDKIQRILGLYGMKMKRPTHDRRRSSGPISMVRTRRLHRLIGLLAQGAHRREDILDELGIGLRTFYRELELVKRCGIKVRHQDRTYSLSMPAEQAERRLPFTDPHLSFAEIADLSRHPGPASRRLAELLARATAPTIPTTTPRGAPGR